jgi:hypothetical protein
MQKVLHGRIGGPGDGSRQQPSIATVAPRTGVAKNA